MSSITGQPGKGPAEIARPQRCAHLTADPRGYPIIATVGQPLGKVDFGTLSEQRKLALATFDLCAVCAHPFGTELRWQVGFDGLLPDRFTEAPVHEICALYAAQVCPFVSSPHARLGDDWRKGLRRPELLTLTGFHRTKAVTGGRSGLQRDSVLLFEMAGPTESHQIRTAEQAWQLYAEALTTDTALAPVPAEQALIDVLCSPTAEENEDSGGVMAGAAWYCGAAFCPNVRKVQGMDRFIRPSSYDQIAARLVLRPTAAADLAESNDMATRAAMNWLLTRTELPEVLSAWRRRGRRQLLDSAMHESTDEQRKKTKRKQQATGRRRNRR
ncbi:hypothetical protein [Crossiella cryophila]|uniref:Uncharacterized protein n=1 Tax=Crossiella cryophila TaxID=43355 RepID=A0A7W7CA84_9PSEU|nr:hypothetical protein [Crossiella cryophila]MBB4677427.1 hypothetical protein [Crossiella cryophila]